MPEKPFPYYRRLSPVQKRTYRQSDAVGSVPLPDPDALRPLVAELEQALASGKRVTVARTAGALSDALFRQLRVAAARIRVREVRPRARGGELHGLYSFAQSDRGPVVEVWMRTAAHRQVVRFPTFLRTLMHELAHHLDVTLLGLGDSLHTRGFFKRESSLVRQLSSREPRERRMLPPEPSERRMLPPEPSERRMLPPEPPERRQPPPARAGSGREPAKPRAAPAKSARPVQMSLFGEK